MGQMSEKTKREFMSNSQNAATEILAVLIKIELDTHSHPLWSYVPKENRDEVDRLLHQHLRKILNARLPKRRKWLRTL